MTPAQLLSTLRFGRRGLRQFRHATGLFVGLLLGVGGVRAAESNPADNDAISAITANAMVSSSGAVSTNSAIDDHGHTVTTITSLTGPEHVSIPASTTLILDNPAANVFDGRFTGGGVFEKTGAGTFTFSALSNVNNFNFAGTIQLDSSVMEFQGGSASGAMTIGTLELTGGTLLLSDAYVNVKTLTITGNTILDFGNGAGSTLNVDNLYIADGATLTVKNWSGEVDYLFANSNFRLNDSSGTSAEYNVTGKAPQNQIVFETGGTATGSQTAWINYNYSGYTNFEIRPIPEPSTYGLVFVSAGLGLLGWRRSRRGSK
jgi:hypothetical protein